MRGRGIFIKKTSDFPTHFWVPLGKNPQMPYHRGLVDLSTVFVHNC